MVFKIAVYGKGGIGKSTVSANISYSLASKGKTVLQIGCDPKSDSTRLLLGGMNTPTVLDLIHERRIGKCTLDDIMQKGSGGVMCLEAGGPEPGIGCAGKGILTMFQTLEKLGLADYGNDITLYDVLGDVVCGGFAIPMRPDYADAIIIVTSGEFMSLYAANNIMKGLMNFRGKEPRLAGLIFNSKGSDEEEEQVREFSRATKIPVLAKIPHSDLFMTAEGICQCIEEAFPESDIAPVFSNLSEQIIGLSMGIVPMFDPHPLSDDQLNQLAAGSMIKGFGEYNPRKKNCSSSPTSCSSQQTFAPRKRIGMGPIGAAVTAGKLTDVPIVIHGSRSCGYSMLNEIYDQRLTHLRTNPNGRIGTGDNLFCSGIGTSESIFGGTDNLEDLLERLAPDNRLIIVVMTCLTSMIGDDCRNTIKNVESNHPGIRIPLIYANEAVVGSDAHMEVLSAIADLIDPSKEPDGVTVRVIDDNFIAMNRGRNKEILQEIMNAFGKKVGPGFLEDCTLQDVIDMRNTTLAFVSEPSPGNMVLSDILKSKGIPVAMRPLPKGHREGCEWIAHLGSMFSNQSAADTLLQHFTYEFDQTVSESSEILSGKTIALFDDRSETMDWIEETLQAAGVKNLVRYTVGPGPIKQHLAPVVHHDHLDDATETILSTCPDLVIGDPCCTRSLKGLVCEDYPHTTLGTPASVMLLKRLTNLLSVGKEESWRNWGEPLE